MLGWGTVGRRGMVRRALRGAVLATLAPSVMADAQSPVAVPYRPPTIALVQPPVGTTVPQDSPGVVFRFGQGEPADPIDAMSFAVSVDGNDRTEWFQVSGSEAWGTLADPPTGTASPIAIGNHRVSARICSTRGACVVANADVVIAPAQVPSSASPTPRKENNRRRLLEALLDAARRLLIPQVDLHESFGAIDHV
jgi:hypothetical protein